MKIKCLHGFYILEETKVGELANFQNYTGLSLAPWENYFTFDFLVPAPFYSIQGKKFLDFTAVKTFAGNPWEVFKANGVIYDWNEGLLKPITAVTTMTTIKAAGNKYVTPGGLILPGSRNQDGDRVQDYAAFWSRETLRFTYSEVTYV